MESWTSARRALLDHHLEKDMWTLGVRRFNVAFSSIRLRRFLIQRSPRIHYVRTYWSVTVYSVHAYERKQELLNTYQTMACMHISIYIHISITMSKFSHVSLATGTGINLSTIRCQVLVVHR